MSHWDFAGASHDDPYAADADGADPYAAEPYAAEPYAADADGRAAPEFTDPFPSVPPVPVPPVADGGAGPGAGWEDGFAFGGDPDAGVAGEDEACYPLTYERAGDDPGPVSPPAPARIADDEPAPDGEDGGGPGHIAGGGSPSPDGYREGGWRPPSRAYTEEGGGRGEAPPLFGVSRRIASEPSPAGSPAGPAPGFLASPAPGSPASPEPAPAWLDWELEPGRRRGGLRRVRRPGLLAAGIAVAAAAGAGTAVLLAGHPVGPGAATSASRGAGATTTPAPGTTGATTLAPGTTGAGGARSGAASPAPAGASSAASSSASSSAGASSPAGVAAAGGAPGGSAPLTLTQAQAVVAAYTTANNAANAARSDTALAAIETGSSEVLDASLYRQGRAAGTAPFPAFGPVRATYYLPRGEPAGGTRWFAVQVANAFTTDRAKVTSTEYLLFTQASPGGPWLNALEPYLLSGAGAPPVAAGPGGLATAVAPDAADAVAPGRLAAVTAAALDATGSTRPAVGDPGNLADRMDADRWRSQVPGGTVTDTHAPASGTTGQEFALRTTDGGALVFYTDAATVTVTPPAGTTLHVNVPGFVSPRQSLSQATVNYLEQFAAYDPPAGRAEPGVVADYSAITGTGTGTGTGTS